MKALYLLLITALLLCSCEIIEKKRGTKKGNNLSEKSNTVKAEAEISMPDFKEDFWIISISATESKDHAISQVKELRKKDPNYGYLWIPDYRSLSEKELYTIFKGPYSNEEECIPALLEYQKIHPNAYAVIASTDDEIRKVIYGKFDIRFNNKVQNLILIYSNPEYREKYTGDDWGWFAYHVRKYMEDNYNDIYFGSVYDSWFSDSDIRNIESEAGSQKFGYLCVKEIGEKLFIRHEGPGLVVSYMCDFFEYECNAELFNAWYGNLYKDD